MGKSGLEEYDSRPEYSNLTWFGLLFGCGMGVGLVFWGVAEPLTHYLNPVGVESATPEAADFAMKSFFMHWGILPWANYAVIGLALAYFMFRKNKKGLVSSILEPLLGEKMTKGWLGKLVDILAVFATVAGIVTSLGLGTMQINAGFNKLFGIPTTLLVQIGIVVVVSILYIGSAVSGIEKGIKVISDTNLYVAIGLLLVCFLVGPKIEILDSFVNGIGQYIGDFIPDALKVGAYGDNSWLGSWETVLLGVVYRMGSVCRRFYCQNLKGKNNQRVCPWSRPCTGICVLHLGSGIWKSWNQSGRDGGS